MPFYLGIDVGGTKTHALIADDAGDAVALGQAGAGNHEGVGYEGFGAAMQTALQDALTRANLTVEQIAGAGFGIGGYDWASEREPIFKVIGTLGLSCPMEAVNDAVIGLIAGASAGWGVSLIAGTGCNCYGRNRNGRIGRMTGEGWGMGEAAGAGELVEEAVRQIARAWSKRGLATALTPAFVELTGARSAEDLLEGLCERYYDLDAEAARVVFDVAAQGDMVARLTIEWAGRQLGDLANGVIRQLELEQQEFEIVMAGSLFEGGQMLIRPLRETVCLLAPRAQFVRLSAPPVVGGVLLGMEQAGITDPALRRRLIPSAQSLFNK